MVDAQKFPYKIIDGSPGMVDRMPYLSLKLSLNDQSLNAEGLLNTGASVNVLPYQLGTQLGLIWEDERSRFSWQGTWLALKLAQSLLKLKSSY
jgi:hypothetical protein